MRRRVLRGFGALIAALSLALVPTAVTASATPSPHSLVAVQKPHIDGLPVVGNRLKAWAGEWSGAGPLFISYAWRSHTKTLLSTSQDYVVTKSDIGQVLTVRVSVQDGDNNTAYADASTVPVTASDVVNTAPPKFSGGLVVGDTVTVSNGTFTSGSGALTYTYAWSASDGQSTTPLADTGTTHVLTNTDLGLYLSVVVTAKSPTQLGTATVRTPGAVIPAPPFASDAAMTSSNHGELSVKTSGNVATIRVPGGKTNDGVFVYGYSKPTVIGWFALNRQHRFSVGYSMLSSGDHKLAVVDQSGKVLGWVAVVRAAPAVPLFATANAPIGIAAAVFVVIVIVVLVFLARWRRRKRRRH
jgi:hypothetical protein